MFRRPLCLILAVGLVGCDARTEVAKDKVLAQVDHLLGEINVEKKKAEIGVRQMEAGLDEIKRGKLEAKVRCAQYAERLADVEGKVASADKTLVRLRDHLKADTEVSLNGKTFKPQDLKDMADKTITARKKLGVEADALRGSKKRFEAVAASLEQREQDGRDRLKSLKHTLDEMDAKSAALRSMQEAARIGGGTQTLDFEAVEKQVRGLSARLDTELAFHDEKWKEQNAAPERSLDAIVRDTSTAGDTVSEIDRLIGK